MNEPIHTTPTDDALLRVRDIAPEGFDPAEDEEEAGLYEHFAVTADKGQTPMRLDKFLTVRKQGGNVIKEWRPRRNA